MKFRRHTVKRESGDSVTACWCEGSYGKTALFEGVSMHIFKKQVGKQ